MKNHNQRNICFYFQVHQPYRLRPYRFFDIGRRSDYFDETKNAGIMQKVAEKCYLPTNHLLLNLIRRYGDRFKISFSISGTALEQFQRYAPDVLESFAELAQTGNVEFLAETYAHSLSALKSKAEFERQVRMHTRRIKTMFGMTPRVFRNTELIYSDRTGRWIADMGYEAALTEGADHVLGWRSPNFLYNGAGDAPLKLLLKNYRLSDDIAFRFSQRDWPGWPLTANKFVSWLNNIPAAEPIVNLFMDYETFGEHQWQSTGIFQFLEHLPEAVFSQSEFGFITPSEAISNLEPAATLSMPNAVSWADEERDLSAWLGNPIQDDAYNSLYKLEDKVNQCKDPAIHRDWLLLQTSDHFYYMCTKYFADGDVHKYFNPYESPYEAFINYMNVLADFELRLDASVSAPRHTEIKEEMHFGLNGKKQLAET
jgi:alpha-amylase